MKREPSMNVIRCKGMLFVKIYNLKVCIVSLGYLTMYGVVYNMMIVPVV